MNQDIVFVLRQEIFSSILEVLVNSGQSFSVLDVFKTFGLGDAIWCDSTGVQDLPNMNGDIECRRDRYPVDIKI